jgi:hypothetical protein
VSQEAIQEAKHLVDEGGSVEDVLRVLKAAGANAIASIQALQDLLGVSTAEAQQLLHDSDTWRGMRKT